MFITEGAPYRPTEGARKRSNDAKGGNVTDIEHEVLVHEDGTEWASEVEEKNDHASKDNELEKALVFLEEFEALQEALVGSGVTLCIDGMGAELADKAKGAQNTGGCEENNVALEAIVHALNKPARSVEEGHSHEAEYAIAKAEIFAANTLGDELLNPRRPAYATDGTKEGNEAKENEERIGGGVCVINREKRQCCREGKPEGKVCPPKAYGNGAGAEPL